MIHAVRVADVRKRAKLGQQHISTHVKNIFKKEISCVLFCLFSTQCPKVILSTLVVVLAEGTEARWSLDPGAVPRRTASLTRLNRRAAPATQPAHKHKEYNPQSLQSSDARPPEKTPRSDEAEEKSMNTTSGYHILLSRALSV